MNNTHYIQAFRVLDRRTIFILAELGNDRVIQLLDILTDSQFLISKIEKDQYIFAKENCTWVYTIVDDNFSEYVNFLEKNYERTIKLLGGDKPPLKLE